jgi:hypothetical protein
MIYVWCFVRHLDVAKQLYCSYLLPSLETLHKTTTKKSIGLFTDVAIHEVTWYVTKQKKMTERNGCTTQPKKIFMVLLITLLELCARL